MNVQTRVSMANQLVNILQLLYFGNHSLLAATNSKLVIGQYQKQLKMPLKFSEIRHM